MAGRQSARRRQSSRTRTNRTRRNRRPSIRPVYAWTAAGIGVFLLLVLAFWFAGNNAEDNAAEKSAGKAAQNRSKSEKLRNPGSIPLPEAEVGTLRLDTPQPGFTVLVDGQPARNDEGQLLKTPCEVRLRRGDHHITLARKGYADLNREIRVEKETEAVFTPSAQSSGSAQSILEAAYFHAPVGEPIPLLSLHSPGMETDPYLSPDGNTIWFVGDREEGQGIYTARRPSHFHAFGRPKLLEMSRGPDRPASPSATADQSRVVYTVPEKARIWASVQPTPDGQYDDKTALIFKRGQPAVWPSAQILADGRRLYWVQEMDGRRQTLLSTRQGDGGEFRPGKPVELPGRHPCLSSDGLRQYLFDGQILRRARRAEVDSPFSEPEVVANLEIPGYEPAPAYRQFWVSEDEQWLFYSDNPREEGNLYLIRVFRGKGWGVVPRGRKLPEEQRFAVKTDKQDSPEQNQKPKPKQDEQPQEPVDPRTQPLPYAAHWQQFRSLLADRQYEEAGQLVEKHLAASRFANDQEVLQWDRQDLRRVRGFWDEVRDVLNDWKPGEPIRIGAVKLSFSRFEAGTIHANLNGKAVSQPIREMRPSDLVSIAEEALDAEDPEAQLHVGIFLHYDRQGNPRRASSRFEEAGSAGNQFTERLARRKLHLARQEINRDNTAAGLDFLEQLMTGWPDSEAAREAETLRDKLYQKTQWRTVGSRQWNQPQPGTFVAEATSRPGSLLLSPREYENFELRLQWKTEGETGQGGVYFGYPSKGDPYSNAYKIALANDHGVSPDQYSTGALFGMAAPEENAVRPEGEWNTLRLRVWDEELRVVVNGKTVLETILLDPEITQKGYVALDGGVGGIAYRRTLLVEVPDGESSSVGSK